MNTTAVDAVPQSTDEGKHKTVFAGAFGNVMEWYDFAVYAYMAPYISKLFFPSDDSLTSLMATFGAFAAGYLSRPLGAMIFGHMGDKIGRKFVLMVSVVMMGLATTAIGFMPTYATIGVAAPIILIVLRIIQGISVGGEYTGSATFIIEHAPDDKRGFFGSWVLAGSMAGFLLGSAVATALTNLFNDATMADWAWRLPFLSGALIAICGILLRMNVEEPEGSEIEHDTSPIILAFRDHWRDILRIIGLSLAVNVGFYMIFVYAVSYLTDVMHVSTANAMDINTICMVVLVFCPIIAGFISDKIGRKPVLISGAVLLVVLAYPLFSLLHHTDYMMILAAQLGFAILFSWIYGANPSTQVEILSRPVRVSVLSIGYNVCMSVFGGTTPLIATYLVSRTADDFAPVYYLIGASILSLIAVLTIPETARKPLRED